MSWITRLTCQYQQKSRVLYNNAIILRPSDKVGYQLEILSDPLSVFLSLHFGHLHHLASSAQNEVLLPTWHPLVQSSTVGKGKRVLRRARLGSCHVLVTCVPKLSFVSGLQILHLVKQEI